MKSEIINLTSHPINYIDRKTKQTKAVYPSQGCARLDLDGNISFYIEDVENEGVNVPVFAINPCNLTGLPEPKGNTMYIVSKVVKDNCPNRSDLIVPTCILKDRYGSIIGCMGFSM